MNKILVVRRVLTYTCMSSEMVVSRIQGAGSEVVNIRLSQDEEDWLEFPTVLYTSVSPSRETTKKQERCDGPQFLKSIRHGEQFFGNR